ncbi:uncharacterized protein LOC134232301 [Saccostrea cucullata]|uniref:uncharacterized protein LOC134232301 n=1 Tax=Saccostrea cuccullata TaxID=36930 RepID=UPI002ED5614A
MKILFYFASLLVLVLTKEDISGLDQYLQDPSFWQFVEKRLGSKNDVEQKAPVPVTESPPKVNDQYDPFRDQSDEDTSVAKNDQKPKQQDDLMEDTLGNLCQYRPNASLIIRSKASINNGAFFLKSFNRRTQKECVNACCYTQSCNLVVYENKDEHSCYLFNCGSPSKCLFAEHANYTSLFFPNHAAPSTSLNGHQQQHENELEGLNSKVTLKPTTQVPKRKVPLYGKCDIDWNDECSDRNAECRDRECKCSYGFHAKYGICRANCPDSEFECENKGQRVNVPECISKEHVCDGQPQCADGSDEEKCPSTALTTKTTSTTTTTTTTPKPVTTKPSQQNVNSLGVNDQILPQYFPGNLNKLPTGSDLYNGNGYYWPSGYGRMYGSQSYPYGRFQPGAQYPYDPRFYNSYDSSGRQYGNGYIDPVRGYYDKSVPDSKSVSSQTGSGNGRAGSPKTDHSNEKLIPLSQGRDGALDINRSGKKGSDFQKEVQVKTTQMPTTVNPTTRQVTTRGSFNTWKISNQQTNWDKTNKDNTGWRGNFENSKTQINHDIPSWKSNEGTQKSAQESQNKWQNVMDSSQSTKYDQVMDNADHSLGKGPLKQQTPSDKTDWQKSSHDKQQTDGSSADKIQTEKQDVPVSQSGSGAQRNWNQHTESNMDNNSHGNTGIETEVKGSQGGGSQGRVSEGKSESGGSKDKTSGGFQGKSDRWHQQQEWATGRNKDMGQTNNRHKGQDIRNGGSHQQGRTRGGSKGRKGGGYHRKQSNDNASDRLTDNSSKDFTSKQQVKPQNTDYDNYFQETSQNGQNVAGPKKHGYRKPAYKSQKPHSYQYYDGYRPDPYWNYDYYNYNDHPDKKYPPPYDQTDSDNDRDWFHKSNPDVDDVDDNDDDKGKKLPPTPKAPPIPTPRPTQKTKSTEAPDMTEIKHIDPTKGKKNPDVGSNSASTTDKKPQISGTKTEKIQTSKKNSTDSKAPDSGGLLEEAVQTHVVVESPTDSHQGPIVALALGLGITVILLFFVGCRLRNVKRRIRKGRALHSNEADYLINGMYL